MTVGIPGELNIYSPKISMKLWVKIRYTFGWGLAE